MCINLRHVISQKTKHEKLQNKKKKDYKIFHGRRNSLKNKVRSWMELDCPDSLKPLPTG